MRTDTARWVAAVSDVSGVFRLKLRSLISEVARYSVVGISSFLLDSVILVVCKEWILHRYGEAGTILSTGIGFVAGTVFNYIFSNRFVFRQTASANRGRHLMPFLLFFAIGVIGLGLTELGMAGGIGLFGDRHYLAIKFGVGLLVFIWNYSTRKALIFRESSRTDAIPPDTSRAKEVGPLWKH